MITDKNSLNRYLEADKKALGRKRRKPDLFDFIWKYQICLRKLEYYINTGGGIVRKYYYCKYQILGLICGFEIHPNNFEEGLSIAHKGTIVVNGSARIGKNCRLHTCVNIGTLPGSSYLAPRIGDNVYIGPGAKIYGNIEIASNIVIGANAVVGRSFTEPNICIAGAPARDISTKGRDEIESQNRNHEQSQK